MLPTVTMNPTSTPSASGNAKRDLLDEMNLLLNKQAAHTKRDIERHSSFHWIDLDMLWWAGVGMTIFGGAAYLI
jgi:hypothetical protein